MDPVLKELCLQMLSSDSDGERFEKLLFETGIQIDCFEWGLITKILYQHDPKPLCHVKFGKKLH